MSLRTPPTEEVKLGSLAMTRRRSSRRTRWVSSKLAPATAKVPVKRAVISDEMTANSAASRRRVWPKSVPVGTTPALTMPISLAPVDSKHQGQPVRAAGRAQRGAVGLLAMTVLSLRPPDGRRLRAAPAGGNLIPLL
jgi:hypothetical protein